MIKKGDRVQWQWKYYPGPYGSVVSVNSKTGRVQIDFDDPTYNYVNRINGGFVPSVILKIIELKEDA